MPRVKCPHCGAGNQDATEEDKCWQCGNVLGAPPVRDEAEETLASIFTAPTEQLNPDPNSPVPLQRAGAPRSLVTVLVVVLLFIAALVFGLFLMTAQR